MVWNTPASFALPWNVLNAFVSTWSSHQNWPFPSCVSQSIQQFNAWKIALNKDCNECYKVMCFCHWKSNKPSRDQWWNKHFQMLEMLWNAISDVGLNAKDHVWDRDLFGPVDLLQDQLIAKRSDQKGSLFVKRLPWNTLSFQAQNVSKLKCFVSSWNILFWTGHGLNVRSSRSEHKELTIWT